MTTQAFRADMISLATLIRDEARFVIPLYQRLYVWKPEQVQRLMDDITSAWCQSKDRDNELHYLGAILAIKRTQGNGVVELELIDGQQRLTTLWLLALAWSDDPEVVELSNFIQVGEGEKRIRFAIRKGADRFIETAMAGNPESCAEALAMEEALQLLKGYPDNIDEFGEDKPARAQLSKFIVKNVRLALTEVPEGTDLNKLFEVINNRGEQLQHHDILKKRFLEEINDHSSQAAYASIWDACAAMDDYVERNFARAHGVTIKNTVERWAADASRVQLGDVKAALDALESADAQGPGKLLSLEQILEHPEKDQGFSRDTDPEDENGASVRSIISFPMLLQHTLRLYRQEKGLEDLDHINDKDLLDMFDRYFLPASEEEAIAFIEKLWQVRAAFEDYVVKWIEREEGDKQLHVRQIRMADGNYSRSVDGLPTGLSLLQAVIYHSQGKTSQYWLTPFLKFCLQGPTPREAWDYLRHLEHGLFTVESDQNLRERSHYFLDNQVTKEVGVMVPRQIRERHGTDFRHYWFYKTEYVLWENRKSDREELPDGFRIVSRNSVEHILPQHSLERDNAAGKWLNAFANLALINREMNSRFSNDIFDQKRTKYRESRRNSPSLMLDLVFDYKNWSSSSIEQHQKKLEKEWESYLSRLAEPVKAGCAFEGNRGRQDVKGR